MIKLDRIKNSIKNIHVSKKPLIWGIDPGTTIGYASIDIHGNPIIIGSERNVPMSIIVSIMACSGNPIVVATDKSSTPEYVRKISAMVGARLIFPNRDLKADFKRVITYRFKHLAINSHELDALACALYAYEKLMPLLVRSKKAADEYNVSHEMVFSKSVLEESSVTIAARVLLEEEKSEAQNPLHAHAPNTTPDISATIPNFNGSEGRNGANAINGISSSSSSLFSSSSSSSSSPVSSADKSSAGKNYNDKTAVFSAALSKAKSEVTLLRRYIHSLEQALEKAKFKQKAEASNNRNRTAASSAYAQINARSKIERLLSSVSVLRRDNIMLAEEKKALLSALSSSSTFSSPAPQLSGSSVSSASSISAIPNNAAVFKKIKSLKSNDIEILKNAAGISPNDMIVAEMPYFDDKGIRMLSQLNCTIIMLARPDEDLLRRGLKLYYCSSKGSRVRIYSSFAIIHGFDAERIFSEYRPKAVLKDIVSEYRNSRVQEINQ